MGPITWSRSAMSLASVLICATVLVNETLSPWSTAMMPCDRPVDLVGGQCLEQRLEAGQQSGDVRTSLRRLLQPGSGRQWRVRLAVDEGSTGCTAARWRFW